MGIIADAAMARKGLEFFAHASGLRVASGSARPDLVLRVPDAGAEMPAAIHIVVDAQSVFIEARRPPDAQTVEAAARLVHELLKSWVVSDD